MADIVNSLVEMGFPEEHVKFAVSKTSGKDLQETMDWLLSHQDDIDKQVYGESSSSLKNSEEEIEDNTDLVAKSIKCEDCGRLFKSQLEVEFHAAKSGHSNFSESTEEKKPLTEEEKKAQIAKVEELLKKKRQEREEKEKLDELEREKNRIRSGRDMLEAKRKIEELEIKKVVEERKREKEEDKLARQRVREQIEQDKLARKIKFAAAGDKSNEIIVQSTPISLESTNVVAKSNNYTQTKLQIRLPDGQSLTQTFGAKEPLSAVRLYIEIKQTSLDEFKLMTSFPKRIFSSEDYDKPLDSLGLAPSAVIIVSKI